MYHSMVHVASLNFLIGLGEATIRYNCPLRPALGSFQNHSLAYVIPMVEEFVFEALLGGEAGYSHRKPWCLAQNPV